MERIGVACSFEASGRVRVRRIELDGRWTAVAQGRQWLDEEGRHVLVMLPDEKIKELVLSAHDLAWRLVSRPKPQAI
ncbi:MAG: hypothetical protein RRC07_01010 [Anaerolineae bacterium]|nr:hypothetical protein [Anaerolineae bacterium]